LFSRPSFARGGSPESRVLFNPGLALFEWLLRFAWTLAWGLYGTGAQRGVILNVKDRDSRNLEGYNLLALAYTPFARSLHRKWRICPTLC